MADQADLRRRAATLFAMALDARGNGNAAFAEMLIAKASDYADAAAELAPTKRKLVAPPAGKKSGSTAKAKRSESVRSR